MRPKTPRIKPIKSRLCDKIPNIEKEVTLLEVAEKLEKIVFNMHNESDIDLISKKFNTYVNNRKNYLDEKIQKMNIQNNLNKELEYKAKNKEKESDINKNLQKALVGLDELLKKYSDPEKKRQRESKSPADGGRSDGGTPEPYHAERLRQAHRKELLRQHLL